MTLAQDLLTGLLAGTHPDPPEPPLISSTIVSTPRPITSLEAFNAQLILGSKDESLRKAASVFKTAAESVERMQTKSEKYWLDGLRIRQSNWGLIPAPLPPGSATGKGADRTTKDFVISYGLEGCESVPYRCSKLMYSQHRLRSEDEPLANSQPLLAMRTLISRCTRSLDFRSD